jgi:hypothetical protein
MHLQRRGIRFFRWLLWSDSSCVALRQLSTAPASQEWLEDRKLSAARFLFLCYDRARPIWADAPRQPFIGGAFVLVFILHLGEVI